MKHLCPVLKEYVAAGYPGTQLSQSAWALWREIDSNAAGGYLREWVKRNGIPEANAARVACDLTFGNEESIAMVRKLTYSFCRRWSSTPGNRAHRPPRPMSASCLDARLGLARVGEAHRHIDGEARKAALAISIVLTGRHNTALHPSPVLALTQCSRAQSLVDTSFHWREALRCRLAQRLDPLVDEPAGRPLHHDDVVIGQRE
jgi:hypothetical protein